MKLTNYFLQIFFIRITRCDKRYYRGLMRYIGFSYWYSIQGWIVPFTGWRNEFKFIGKRFNKRITKTRILRDITEITKSETK